MIDYNRVIYKANVISNQASILRQQARAMDRLSAIVGHQYVGKDAQCYAQAVAETRHSLIEIADSLDQVAYQIRASAKRIQEEESALLAAAESQ